MFNGLGAAIAAGVGALMLSASLANAALMVTLSDGVNTATAIDGGANDPDMASPQMRIQCEC